MGSCSKKTEAIRKNKKTNMGKTRKAKEQNQGTTLSKKDLFKD